MAGRLPTWMRAWLRPSIQWKADIAFAVMFGLFTVQRLVTQDGRWRFWVGAHLCLAALFVFAARYNYRDRHVGRRAARQSHRKAD